MSGPASQCRHRFITTRIAHNPGRCRYSPLARATSVMEIAPSTPANASQSANIPRIANTTSTGIRDTDTTSRASRHVTT